MDIELDEIESLAVAPSADKLEAERAALEAAETEYAEHVRNLEGARALHEANVAAARARFAATADEHDKVLRKVLARRGQKTDAVAVEFVSDEKGSRLVMTAVSEITPANK